MKTLSLAIISTAIILASCSSSKYTAATDYDDVYYNPNTAEAPPAYVAQEPAVSSQDAMNAQAVSQEQTYTKTAPATDEGLSDYEVYKLQKEAEMLGEGYTPEGSEALYAEQYVEYDTLGQYGQESAPVIINNYYADPTDYYYSSSLRRFSDSYYGWNYYDPYYTDMYWYTGSPYSWGISLGWGYPAWGIRFSYGYPYYRPYYGYGGYYDPYYSWGWGGYYGYPYGGYYPYYGYGSYWTGYYHGWYSGYYYGSGGYYPESSYRYGHLSSRHSYGYSYRPREVASSAKGSRTGDPRYRSRTSTASVKSAVATRSDARYSNSATQRQQVRNATGTATQRTVRTTRTTQPSSVQQRSSTVNRRNAYTPSYSKPRTTSSSSFNRSAVQQRNTYQRSVTSPSRSSNALKQSSSPSRSSATYSRPSSSSRSSATYSRPSSSSRSSSYSRPSSSGSRSMVSVSRSSGGSVSRSSGGSVSRSSGGSVSRSSGGSSRSSSSRR